MSSGIKKDLTACVLAFTEMDAMKAERKEREKERRGSEKYSSFPLSSQRIDGRKVLLIEGYLLFCRRRSKRASWEGKSVTSHHSDCSDEHLLSVCGASLNHNTTS